MSYYTHTSDKKSGDGLAITDWNNLSSAIAGNQGLTLAKSATDKIGVGTASPSEKLHVNGNVIMGESGETMKLGNVGHTGHAGIAHTDRANSTDYALLQHDNGTTFLNSKSDKPLHFRQGNVDKMVIKNGNVGIGTTSPTEKLEVNGKVKATHFVGDGSGLTNLSVGLTGLNLATSSGNVGIGTTSPSAKLEVSGEVKATSLTTSGNVGVGTTSPLAKLDIKNSNRTGTNPTTVKGLYVTGDFDAAANGVEFRHSNQTQGIGFGFCSIYAAGSNTDQHLNLMPKGTGKVGIGTTSPAAKLDVNGSLRVGGGSTITRIIAGRIASNGTILSGSGFTVTKDTTQSGIYVINYSTAFTTAPVVQIAHELNAFSSNIFGIDSLARQACIRVNQYGSGQRDCNFSFIVIGV